ncbi:YjbF family lipoprotein [Salinicola rhizosphaerae]|uniref:YjbF family lipoprotein n=1 Tax=Salinicola rhizosphaerae TaxID=1443141 RepID=A0ABQ3DRJ2_9GAMM|nr:YjbF family lipoprotein [Salinicola rhizosphaerae]GHB09950.1 hypothetical protein GCM10009038_04550 [Salinicola rhizosphaerae]
MAAVRHYCLEDRPRAVFFRLFDSRQPLSHRVRVKDFPALLAMLALPLAMTGCALGESPSINSLLEGATGDDIATQANDTPYASLDFKVDGNGGLIILAEQADALTYWQFSDNATVALQNGYLKSSAGLPSDLIDTRFDASDSQPWRDSQPTGHYGIEREWRTADGQAHHGHARGALQCDSDPVELELPLTTQTLQACLETLTWDDGETTTSTLWRSPTDHRLWAVDTQPWPDGPTFSWRIARPWQTADD